MSPAVFAGSSLTSLRLTPATSCALHVSERRLRANIAARAEGLGISRSEVKEEAQPQARPEDMSAVGYPKRRRLKKWSSEASARFIKPPNEECDANPATQKYS